MKGKYPVGNKGEKWDLNEIILRGSNQKRKKEVSRSEGEKKKRKSPFFPCLRGLKDRTKQAGQKKKKKGAKGEGQGGDARFPTRNNLLKRMRIKERRTGALCNATVKGEKTGSPKKKKKKGHGSVPAPKEKKGEG